MNAKHLIVNCVTEFVNAGDQNDTAALDRVLHPQYQNVQDGLFTQKGLFQISKAEYIKLVGDMVFGGSPRSIDIHGIEEFGEHMAVVDVTLESSKLIFNSKMVTVRDQGDWQVLFNFPKTKVKS